MDIDPRLQDERDAQFAESIHELPVEDPDKEEALHDPRLLTTRNVLALIAAVLILLSLLPDAIMGRAAPFVHGIAYLFGAGAYVTELLVLTDMFRSKKSIHHMFMPYLFGVIYLIVGIVDLFFLEH